MRKLILASLAAGALLLACGVPVARADTSCNTGEEGELSEMTIPGNVVVPPDGICNLSDVTVTGNVTVQGGATLTLDGSTVTGNMDVQTGASLFMVDGSTVGGNTSANQCSSVQIVGQNAINGNFSTQGNVSTSNTSCTTSIMAEGIPTLGGNFVCQNTGSCTAVGVSISGNMSVNGNTKATVNGNSVGGNAQVNNNGSASTVQNNPIISGSLTCLGNKTPFTASNNKVLGTNTCKSS